MNENEKVKLVAYTQLNKDYADLKGLLAGISMQEYIAYVAKVSNPASQNNLEKTDKLLAYMTKNSHWSPFEMAHVVLEINTTREIGRQILRHCSFKFQEFSQRYSDPTQMEFIYSEARLQDAKNRQNSIEVDDEELQQMWIIKQQGVINESRNAYNWATENGIAKEVARKVLPEGLTSTKMFMVGPMRSWLHYIALRTEWGVTQKEHVEIAQACAQAILPVFPMIMGFVNEK